MFFFLTYILQYIFSLSKKTPKQFPPKQQTKKKNTHTHTCPILVCNLCVTVKLNVCESKIT